MQQNNRYKEKMVKFEFDTLNETSVKYIHNDFKILTATSQVFLLKTAQKLVFVFDGKMNFL